MKKRIRLADVANAAGVSQGTASNVFNRPGIVRSEVRDRVLKAAAALGYGGPDPRGRMLRAGNVNALGLVLAGPLAANLQDPFSQMFMAGVAEVCDAHGAGLSLVSAAGSQSAAWNIRTALVDGFVVHCLEQGAELVELARQRGLPFVAVDLDPGPGDSAVVIDDRAAARAQAEHLAALGHTAIGVISLELIGEGRFGLVDRARREAVRYTVTRDRLAGCADAGLDLDRLPVVETLIRKDHGYAATKLIFERAPETTAILAMSDVTALGALAYAQDCGIAVPSQLSIIGFDDIPEAAVSSPPLTTMRQPIAEKGRRAAALIFEPTPPHTETLSVDLVVRGSTAPAA